MTRQEQFKAEMAAIFKKYKVEIDVEESGGYQSYATAITFWSYAEYDDAGEMTAGPIDFKVGTRCVDHTDFQ